MRSTSRIRQIILKQYCHHSLISLLILYEKVILLKQRPSNQLAEISKKQKDLFERPIFKFQNANLSTIQKYLDSPQICCLEISLEAHNIGTIVNSFNTEPTFGYTKSNIFGININNLMPKPIQKQHTIIMEKWVKTCRWNNMGKFLQLYTLDNKDQVFSFKVYFKIVQRFGQSQRSIINIMGTILKQNSKDFMMVDQNRRIIGAGSRYVDLFGKNLIGVPLKFICDDADKIFAQYKTSNRNKKSSTFYPIVTSSSLIKLYHQRANEIINFNVQDLILKLRQSQMADPCHLNIQYQYFPYHVGSVTLLILKIVSIKRKHNRASQNNIQIKYSNQHSSFYQYFHANDNDNDNNSQQEINFSMKNHNQFKNHGQFEMINNGQPSICSSLQSLKSSFENNINRLQSIFYKNSKDQNKVSNQNNKNKTQKENSVCGEKKQDSYKTQKPNLATLYDIRIIRIVCTIIILSLVGIGMSSLKLYMNYNGYDDIQALFFGDGACSDNLQLSMFIYNRALNIYQKVNKISQLHSINKTQQQILPIFNQLKQEMKRKNDQIQYLHSLLINQIQVITNMLTKLTKTKVYAYYNLNTTWINSDQQVSTLLTINFITNFIYQVDRISNLGTLLANIILDTINNSTNIYNISQQNTIKNLLGIMKSHVVVLQNNLPTLYGLNNQYLFYYSGLLLSNSQQIRLIGYLKFGVCMFTITGILLILLYNINYRCRQLQQIYSIFRSIQSQTSNLLLSYFQKIQSYLHNQQPISYRQKQQNKQITSFSNQTVIMNEIKLADTTAIMNKLHQQTLYSIQNPIKSGYFSHNLKFTFANDINEVLPNIKLCIIFLFIFIVNILLLITEYSILNTTMSMMNDINGLMNSQNNLIGPYYQAKGQYILQQLSNIHNEQNKTTLLSIISKVIDVINVTQIQFTRVAIASLALFKNYDSQYREVMIKIIANNVCEQINGTVSIGYYNQCVHEQQMKIIRHGGVIIGMNYFTRTLQQTFHQYYMNTQTVLAPSLIFPVIDKTIFPMFKIYQKTQNKITNSLAIAIDYQNIKYLLIIAMEVGTLFGIFLYMKVFYKKQTEQSVERVGRILLLPVRTMNNNLGITKKFEQISDYNNLYFV